MIKLMHTEMSLTVTLIFPLPLEYFSPYTFDKVHFRPDGLVGNNLLFSERTQHFFFSDSI